MAQGKIPNLRRLKERGSFHRLRTTFPSLSPVAWSTFATGVNPAKHNIFDFLNRRLMSYVPELSASRVRRSDRVLHLGRWRLPLGRPSIEMRRKSKTFWKILGERAIGSTILRVPVTFPPEKFDRRLLSAMCTPDLRGTQGSFSQFSTALTAPVFESGSHYPLKREGRYITGSLEGPENELVPEGGAVAIPFRIEVSGKTAVLEISGETVTMSAGEYSPWIKLRFRAAPGVGNSWDRAVSSDIEIEPEFALYVTPIQIDPEVAGAPDQPSALLRELPGEVIRARSRQSAWRRIRGL